jgi:transposase
MYKKSMNSNANHTERMLLNELARVTAKLQSCERKMQQMKLNERLRNGVLRNNSIGSRNNSIGSRNNHVKRNSNTTKGLRIRYDLRPLPHRLKRL